MEFDNKVFDNWESVLPAINSTDNYISSYPKLIEAAKCLNDNFGEKSVPMVAYLAYGWMPTILKYSGNIDKDRGIFKAATAKTEDEALEAIEKIQGSPTNNAWVGLSKTLHFFNPTIFPIWDSKVANALNLFSYDKIRGKDMYVKYMEFVSLNTGQRFVNIVREEFKAKAGYQISKVRAVEFTLFAIGKIKTKQS